MENSHGSELVQQSTDIHNLDGLLSHIYNSYKKYVLQNYVK
jgi:hypothetical protein